MTAFESLIAEFAGKTGMSIAPAHDGSVSLEADGVYITAQSREERGDVLLFSFPAGDMKPEPMTMAKALSLAAHGLGTGGFYLGISGGIFVLSGSMPLEGASAEDFANKLLLLADATLKVEKALAGAIVEYGQSEIAGRGDSSPSSGFHAIQV